MLLCYGWEVHQALITHKQEGLKYLKILQLIKLPVFIILSNDKLVCISNQWSSLIFFSLDS